MRKKIAADPFCRKTTAYSRLFFTLGVQGSIWFFGAETPQSGVILVAGREPGCLVCLAVAALLLPKNSAGPAGGQKSGLARPQDEGGLISHRGRERSQRSFWLPAGMLPLVHRGYDYMIAQRMAFRLIIPLFSGKSCIRKYSCCCLPAAFPGNAR